MLIFSAQTADAQSVDPNAALTNEVIVAQLPGRSISALVTHQPGATKFTHAIALFPGSPGYMNLRVEGGAIRFGLGGNFLVRARRQFIEDGFLTLIIDAPSDHQLNFWHSYHTSDRYGGAMSGRSLMQSQRSSVRSTVLSSATARVR